MSDKPSKTNRPSFPRVVENQVVRIRGVECHFDALGAMLFNGWLSVWHRTGEPENDGVELLIEFWYEGNGECLSVPCPEVYEALATTPVPEISYGC